MEKPEFYRDDAQAYYDMQLIGGKDKPDAIKALRSKFSIKASTKVHVTPSGEVRIPGVIDDPDPPSGNPVAPSAGGEELPPAAPPPEEEDPPSSPSPEPRSSVTVRSTKRTQVSTSEDDLAWERCLASGDPIAFEPVNESWTPPSPRAASWSTARSHLVRNGVSAPTQAERRQKLKERAQVDARATQFCTFQRLVNMRPFEVRSHLRSSELSEVLKKARRHKTESIRQGQAAARHVMRLKTKSVQEWDEEDWTWCKRITKVIERLRKNGAPVLTEAGAPTRKLHTLRAWGHNPLHKAVISEADLSAILTETSDLAIVHRLVEASQTDGPVLIGDLSEYEAGRAPAFKVLKKGKQELESGERQKCMERKAVWHFHHGRDGKKQATPAVWKSEVNGQTWYVTNTHRAYNATKTLDGAIGRYHAFIKGTA